MKAYLFGTLFVVGCLSTPPFFSPPLFASERSALTRLDEEIEKLEEMKRGYESRALRHDNQAERLQFENRNFLEARRHMELADENRAKAAKIQIEIDRLEAKRQKLLNKSGL